MNDDLAFPGTDDGRTVAEFDAQIKAHNAQVAAPAGYIDQTAVQWIQSHQGGYASASIYPNEVNGTVPFWLDAPAAPVAQGEREALRDAQREAVMPLIGPLLDAWEASSQQCREELPELDKWLRRLNRAMEEAPAAPVAQPLACAPGKPGVVYVDGFGYVDERAVRAIERAHGIGQGGA